MGGDLVEEQERLALAGCGAQPGLRQDQAHQERLLLPGRAVPRRAAGSAIVDQEVAAVRPDRGGPALGVLAPRRRQSGAEALLSLQRGALVEPGLDLSLEREVGLGKAGRRVAERGREAAHRLAPGGGHRHTRGRGLALQRPEPGRVEPTDAQQLRALAHGVGIARELRCMRRIAARHQPVEEAAALAGALLEQPIERRHQPDHGDDLGERRLAEGVAAVDLHDPALALAVLDPARADLDGAAGRVEARRHRPGAGPADAVDLAKPRPAQAAPGGQERDRLEQVGLAGAVRPGQHHRPCLDLEPRPGVAPEIDQREPAHGEARRLARPSVEGERHQTRMGIST